ncbi:hypothetical protein BDR07DRAFT_1402004 [Suillus spraguei]|nr:hypothetical protein BDR07DRAFT_1402004 [Suillus spraguei]
MYEGIRFQDTQPTPLQKFAHRIFSICANSASCERLFSLFGAVLTKLQSQLCLHLRDEYTRMGDKKGRLRRARKIIPDPLHPPPPVTSETSTDSLQPDDLSVSEQPETHNEDEDYHSLGSIASVLAQRSFDDEDATGSASLFSNVPLQQLFNFMDESWVKLTEGFRMRSIDDELEFYELIGMDAEGEDDDQTFDDMMSSTI